MQKTQRWIARISSSESLAATAMLVAGLGLTFLLRAPHYQHPFVFIDEAWWALGSKALADGRHLYTDLWMDKQPPIFILGGFLFQVFGQSMAVIHAVAILLAMLTSILIWRGFRVGLVDSAARTALVAWMAAGFLGVVIGRRFYTNCYVQVLPPMCLLGGLGAIDLWKSKSSLQCRRLFRVVTISFLAVFIWFHARTLAHWIYLAFPDLHERFELWSACREDRELRQIAAHLRSRTNEGDSIFIWGSRAELYWLADRKPAFYCLDYDVRADVPQGAAEARICRETVDALERSLPRYVVDVQGHNPIDRFEFFGEWIREHCELETIIHKARLFRLKEADVDIRTAKQHLERLQDRNSGGS